MLIQVDLMIKHDVEQQLDDHVDQELKEKIDQLRILNVMNLFEDENEL